MKAIIKNLFNTEREIITFDGSEYDYPVNFKDLASCDNVSVGEKIDDDNRCKSRYVKINSRTYIATPTKVRHPLGATMYVIEIY